MTIKTTLMKRRARYRGELGFFADNQMAEEDIALAKMDSEVICSFYSPKNLEALKFLWMMVHRVSDNTDRWLDKDEAMRDLKLRAGYAKLVFNSKTREVELKPKSLTRISDEQLRSLTEKITGIVLEEILPGMKANDLRREIEDMLRDRAA
jgi:hypothetical protein